MPPKLKPTVAFPDLRKPITTWTPAEAHGLVINPILTGMGKIHRSVADEDWVLCCEEEVEKNGLEQFLTDLLHVLRITILMCIGESPPLRAYPRRVYKGEKVPLPNAAFPGDPEWSDDEPNEQMVAGIICNPVYAGIVPFDPIVDDETWIQAGVKMVEEVGLRQYLVNVLYELKKSYSLE